MAIPADTVFEVRTAGSDYLCSGGFSIAQKGATGVDYSQQDAAQKTFAATLSAAATTTLTDSAAGFLNTYLGNLILLVVSQTTGTSTGTNTTTTLNDTGAAWTVNAYQPASPAFFRVTITGGTGNG